MAAAEPDLPSYYAQQGGFVISAAIDQHIYMTLHRGFRPELVVKYSKTEKVAHASQLQHPLFREALKLLGIDGQSLELTGVADVPAGTGLGSSGSFLTCLLRALHAYQGSSISPGELAEQACHIEIDVLREPVGKQDQFISAFGGLSCFTIFTDGRVQVEPLSLSADLPGTFERNLLLYFTGYSRAASAILAEQDQQSRQQSPAMTDNLHRIKELGLRSRDELRAGRFDRWAELLNTHWEQKKQRSGAMSNPEIDRYYALARANGAIGGKLVGAGGGGFLLFYTENPQRLRSTMQATGLREVRIGFDFDGCRVLINTERGRDH